MYFLKRIWNAHDLLWRPSRTQTNKQTCLLCFLYLILFLNIKNEKQTRSCFLNQSIIFLILNELISRQDYYKCLEVFDKFAKHLLNELKKGKRERYESILGRTQMQLIPFSIFRIVSACLLRINTKGSFRQIQGLFNFATETNSLLNNISLTCCFLLAIRQVKDRKLILESF